MAGAKEVGADESGCDQICGNADDALNHVANIFLVPGTFWREFLVDLGYFTMPVMCYFLVEGFGYTRSRKRYGLRLAIFAALSELPFCLAFSRGAVLGYVGMNMIFTLLLCFGMLVVMEAGWDENLKNFLVLALAALSWDSDLGDHCAAFYAALLPRWRGGKAGAAGVSGGDGDLFCRWAGAWLWRCTRLRRRWPGLWGGCLGWRWRRWRSFIFIMAGAVRGDGCFRNGFSMCFTRRICCFWG